MTDLEGLASTACGVSRTVHFPVPSGARCIIGTAHIIWLIVVAEPVPIVAIADVDEEESRRKQRRKQLRRDAQFARREERCACLLYSIPAQPTAAYALSTNRLSLHSVYIDCRGVSSS